MRKTELVAAVTLECRRQHHSLATERTYVGWVSRFFEFSRACPQKPLGDRIGAYLDKIAPRVAQATQDQACCALAFLCNQVLQKPVDFAPWQGARRPRRLPVWLSREEITALFAEMSGTTALMARLCYGSGLRVSDCIRLRLQEVDLSTPSLILRAGKGDKDRVTCLPFALVAELGQRIERLRRLHAEDRAAELPGVQLPGNLVSKYPNAGRELAWQWVFPARGLSRDPRTGTVRRHHLHEDTLAKALKVACRAAGITKRLTCHGLRHSFATHFLEDGGDIHKLQELLGHTHLETTAIYLHCAAGFVAGVRSPLDRIAERKVVPFPVPLPVAAVHHGSPLAVVAR